MPDAALPNVDLVQDPSSPNHAHVYIQQLPVMVRGHVYTEEVGDDMIFTGLRPSGHTFPLTLPRTPLEFVRAYRGKNDQLRLLVMFDRKEDWWIDYALTYTVEASVWTILSHPRMGKPGDVYLSSLASANYQKRVVDVVRSAIVETLPLGGVTAQRDMQDHLQAKFGWTEDWSDDEGDDEDE